MLFIDSLEKIDFVTLLLFGWNLFLHISTTSNNDILLIE